MGEFQALDEFFDEHHRKWRKRVYAIFEDACGHLAVRSEYSRWLNRKTGGRQDTHGHLAPRAKPPTAKTV